MKVHGAAIKAIRTAQDRSLRDVAEASGLSAGYLLRLEKGEKGATEETLLGLAKGLGVHLDAISYPDQPVIQATPETIAQIAQFLSTPVEAVTR